MRLAKPAGRVIALYGALADTLVSMGLGDLLVARTSADASPALSHLPSIGTHMRPNLELVLGQTPDLVVQMSGRKQALAAVRDLRELGVPTAVFNVTSFRDLFSVIARLGALTGRPKDAAALTARLKARLAALRKKTAGAKNGEPTVALEVRYPNLLCAGNASIVADVIKAAGGVNAVDQDKKIVRLSEEELLRLNPDVYLVQQGPMNKNPVPPKDRPHFAPLAAVKNNKVHFVDERRYSRPGPESVRAAEELAALLHPNIKPIRPGE